MCRCPDACGRDFKRDIGHRYAHQERQGGFVAVVVKVVHSPCDRDAERDDPRALSRRRLGRRRLGRRWCGRWRRRRRRVWLEVGVEAAGPIGGVEAAIGCVDEGARREELATLCPRVIDVPHAHNGVSPAVDGVRARLHALPTAARATTAHAIVVAAALLRVADRVFLRQHGYIALRQCRRRTRRRWRQRWPWWRRIKSVSYVSHIPRSLGGDVLPNVQRTESAARLASIIVHVSWQRVGRSKGKAGTVVLRLAGLPALLHRVAAAAGKAPGVVAGGVPAVTDTQKN